MSSLLKMLLEESEEEQTVALHSKAEFEGLFEATHEEFEEICERTEGLEDVKVRLPVDISQKDMERLLLLAEVSSRFFACCEITILRNMCDYIDTLPSDPRNRTLVLHLHRAASFLRRSIFRQGPEIGNGNFGTVYLTRSQYAPKLYALKIVRISIPETSDMKKVDTFMRRQIRALREKETMLFIDHPFICKLRASWVEKLVRGYVHYLFLMEYAPFGTLQDFIFEIFHKTMPFEAYNLDEQTVILDLERCRKNEDGENKPVDPIVRKKLIYIYAAEMASGLEYLHRLGIVHRDVKPSNILIGEDYHLRITDFGLVNARTAYHSFELHSVTSEYRGHLSVYHNPANVDAVTGNYLYCMTPERLSKEVAATTKSFATDMWGLGLIMFLLYCQIHPFISTIPRPNSNDDLKTVIPQYTSNRVLTEPLYSIFIDDVDFRFVVSGLLCDFKNRLTSVQVLQLLNQKVSQFTEKSIEELSRSPLDFMVDVLPRKVPESPDFESWSPVDVSPYSPQGAPAAIKTFPFCAESPVISQPE